ncbi:MAG: 2-C-methyl-D-erythritol 2,4-cyclodiphosphate synthase [Fimbriimonadaceae bacterium]
MRTATPTDDPGVADVAVVIVAAGSGARFGSDKIAQSLGGKPLWRWSYDLFLRHPAVAEIVVVGGDHLVGAKKRVDGGPTRQESSRLGVEAVSSIPSYILVHDAARPFVSEAVVDAVIAGCRAVGAAAPVVPVVDTLRSTDIGAPPVDRARLVAMQTPQGGLAELVRRAHAAASEEHTDEVALIEALGSSWQPVQGSYQNFKVTVPEDLIRARAMLTHETRTGFGYDVHAFSRDPDRPLWLGGVHFPDHAGLDGHSDADVLLHAVADALLGGGVMGDIGQHFAPGDPRWKNMPSVSFIEQVGKMLAADGWEVVHIDSTVVAETPKVMAQANAIRARIATALRISASQVSVKATTNEGLGSIGRGEGIAALATATIERWTN